jgi:hypothetical protein
MERDSEWIPVLRGKCSGVPTASEQNIFPVIGRGRVGRDYRQKGTKDGGIQARRPVRSEQNCEQCGPDNPSPLSRRVLGRFAPALAAPAVRGI